MQFESDGENVQIVGLEAVNHISELTDTDSDSVSKSLLYRTVATGGGEVIEKGHTEKEACFGRDAFAKVPFTCFMCLFNKSYSPVYFDKIAYQDEIYDLYRLIVLQPPENKKMLTSSL